MTRAHLLFVIFAANAASCTATYDSGDFEVCEEPVCEDMLEPYSGAPVCSAATIDCAVACETEACLLGCLDGDPGAFACAVCGTMQFAVCARDRGCRCEYDALNCCRVDRGCMGLTCLECETEQEVWGVCVQGMIGDCEAELRECGP